MTSKIIDDGRGNPIIVQARRFGDGVHIAQGRSYVVIGAAELDEVLAAIDSIRTTTNEKP